ncbi:MAG: PAS domain S-box protein [Phycisphaerales bacterium]|nr:MAG: PAS domain S-box protein [Phycisphaerales bacterium]
MGSLHRDKSMLKDPGREALQRVVDLAARLTGSPMAAVSVSCGDRIVFAATHGFDLAELPRKDTICAQCVAGEEPLVVPDAAADPRFMGIEGVRAMPIGFYAGVPVRDQSGRVAAALCVFGTEARGVPDEHVQLLSELALFVTDLATLSELSEHLHRATEELAEKHERLTLLSHVAAETDNAVVITDKTGRICWVNDGFTRITEFTLDEVLGKTPGSVLHGPETDRLTVAMMREKVASVEGFSAEVVNYSKSGRRYWLAIDVQPIVDDNGQVTHFIAIERDITEEKNRREQLNAQRELLAGVLEASLDGVYALSSVRDEHDRIVDFRFIMMNHAAQDLLGKAGSDVAGMMLTEVFPGVIEAGLLERYIRVAETGEAFRCELRYDRPDLRGWFEVSAARVGDGVAVTFRNIDERKHVETELSISHDRFRMLSRATEDVVWDYDVASGRIWWNENLGPALGWRPDQVGEDIGWRVSVVHPEDRSRVVEGFERAVEGSETHWAEEYRFLKADGNYSSVLDRAYIIRDESGNAVRVVGAAIDLTARQNAASQIEFQKSLLEAQAEASSDGILVTDSDGRILRFNAAFVSMLGDPGARPGGSGAQAVGRIIQDAHNADDARRDAMKAFDDDDAPLRLEIEFRDGRAMEVRSEPIAEAGGRPLARVWFFRDLTVDRETHRLLRRHNLVLETSNVVLFQWMPEPGWPVSLVSKNVEQFGFRAEDLLSGELPFAKLVHPDDLDRVGAEVAGYIAAGVERYEQEYRIVCGDGSVRWVYDRSVVERDDAGEVVVLHGMVLDITERKLVEQRLAESEARLRDITRQIPGAVYQFRMLPDGSRDFLYISEGVEELCGISHDQLASDPTLIMSMVDAQDAEAMEASIIESAQTMKTWRFEFRIRHTDGSMRWIRGQSVPSAHPDGSIIWHGMISDITDRKASEERMHRLATLLEQTNSIARVGGWELDVQTNDLFLTDEICRICGLPPGTSMDLGVGFDFYPPEVRELVIQSVQRGVDHGEPWDLEVPLSPLHGRETWVRIQGHPVCENGRVVRIHGIMHDITEQYLARRELARRAEELEELRDAAESANRAKSEFIANMSHEIRTPLTAILGYTEILGEESAIEDPKARREAVETIVSAGEHLLTIINDILDISKIEAGRMQIEPVETDLPLLLRDALRLMSVRGKSKGVELNWRLEKPIPTRVRVDPTRLRQTLLNLLGNAVKFTDRGSVSVTIDTTPRDDARLGLTIDITDTGPGLTPEQQKRLFTTFTQADNSIRRRHGGTGLGLVISRRCTELMGGEVDLVWSEPERGSCFRVHLPVEVLPGSALASSLEESTQSGQPRSASRMAISGRILLAEDGVDNQRLIGFHLRRAGATVDIAENGREALQKFREAVASGKPYDVVLTDIQMPEMDGLELTRALRAEGVWTPIIAITAHAMAEDRQRCLDAGCDDYTSKPIDGPRLLGVCFAWIGRKSDAARNENEAA